MSPVDRDLAYLQGLQYSKVYGAVQISPVDRDLAYLQALQYSEVYGEVHIFLVLIRYPKNWPFFSNF